jgi:hypothetical protein
MAKGKKGTRKVMTFDPSKIPDILQDVKDVFESATEPGKRLVADVISLLRGQSSAKSGHSAAKPVACPDDPGEDCDCGDCLECAYCCQLHALAATVKAMDAHDAERENGGA